MRRFRLLITAQDENASIVIFDQKLQFNIMTHNGAMLEIIQQIMPTIDWKLDDGKDVVGSDYCTYACYHETLKEGYIFASWGDDF